VLSLGTLILAATTVPLPAAREVRVVMGTAAEVSVTGLADPGPALNAAFAALDRVDRQMSLWKPESELSRLNANGSGQASPDLWAVLRLALEVARDSGGAFDPTVEPLVRAAGHLGEPPRSLTPQGQAALLAGVGHAHLHLEESGRVSLDPGTRLDLGGIAKGYAVDLALAALRQAGANSGLVDLGRSSLAAFGAPLSVTVRDPERESGRAWASFELGESALSTSGGDQRPGHILDPRSGRPASGVLAATVVAKSAMEADALSTAVFVLGVEEGLALLERRRAAGLLLVREEGRPVLRVTRDFARRHRLRPAPQVLVKP